ncbi:hypothetical protein VPH35_005817 [Triticum aestivum]
MNRVKTMVVILVVTGVVALLQTQQAQASHCCCVLVLMPAYLTCRPFGSTSTCCHWLHVGSYHPKTAVDYCKMGCTTSECNKSAQSVVGGRDEGKDIVKRCASGCHGLCTKNNKFEMSKVRDA